MKAKTSLKATVGLLAFFATFSAQASFAANRSELAKTVAAIALCASNPGLCVAGLLVGCAAPTETVVSVSGTVYQLANTPYGYAPTQYPFLNAQLCYEITSYLGDNPSAHTESGCLPLNTDELGTYTVKVPVVNLDENSYNSKNTSQVYLVVNGSKYPGYFENGLTGPDLAYGAERGLDVNYDFNAY